MEEKFIGTFNGTDVCRVDVASVAKVFYDAGNPDVLVLSSK